MSSCKAHCQFLPFPTLPWWYLLTNAFITFFQPRCPLLLWGIEPDSGPPPPISKLPMTESCFYRYRAGRDMPLHWRNLALYASQNFISDFQIPKPQRLCFGMHLWYLIISLHFYLKLSVCLASIRIISPVSDCYFSVLLPLLTPSMLAFSRLPSLILLTCNVMHSPSKISSPLIKKELHLCP